MENEEPIGIPLLEVTERGCRYPVGKDAHRHLFCSEAAFTHPGRETPEPYCRAHCRIAYRDFY